MAQTTTNYSLLKPESTDNYNHLIYDNPNMDTIDSVMKTNSNTGITPATCVKSGTVHTITRTNTSCPVFRFTATGDWNTGDTMIVDGVTASVFMPNGSAALNGAYIINTEVIASIVGTRVTLMSNSADAASVEFDATGTTLSSTNVEDALKELNDASNIVYDANNSVSDMLDVETISFTNINGGLNYVKGFRIGKLVVINFAIGEVTPNSVLFTVPDAIKPANNETIKMFMNTNSSAMGTVTFTLLNSNGNLINDINVYRGGVWFIYSL